MDLILGNRLLQVLELAILGKPIESLVPLFACLMSPENRIAAWNTMPNSHIVISD